MTELSQVLLECSSWPFQDDVFLSVTSENSAVVFPTAVPSGIRFLIKLEVIVRVPIDAFVSKIVARIWLVAAINYYYNK